MTKETKIHKDKPLLMTLLYLIMTERELCPFYLSQYKNCAQQDRLADKTTLNQSSSSIIKHLQVILLLVSIFSNLS